MTAYAGCAGLARSPFVLTEHISSILYWCTACVVLSVCVVASSERLASGGVCESPDVRAGHPALHPAHAQPAGGPLRP